MNAFKSFSNFNEGLKEMKSISTTIKNIFTADNYDYEPAVKRLLIEFNNDIPTINHDDYPRTPAISISANEVGYKSSGQIAFGWRCVRTEDGIRYDFRITVNANWKSAKNNSVIKEAAILGWRIADSKKFTERKVNNDVAEVGLASATDETPMDKELNNVGVDESVNVSGAISSATL